MSRRFPQFLVTTFVSGAAMFLPVGSVPRATAQAYDSAQQIAANNLGTPWTADRLAGLEANRPPQETQLVPSDFFDDTRQRYQDEEARRDSRLAADHVRENWCVVTLLGLSFVVGLTMTLSMIRRVGESQPTRLFGH